MTLRRNIYRGHPYFGGSGDIDASELSVTSTIWEMVEDREKVVEEFGFWTPVAAPLLVGWTATMKALGSAEKGHFLAKTGAHNIYATLQHDELLDAVSTELTEDGSYPDGLVDVRRATAEDAHGEKAEEYSSIWDRSPTRKAGPFCDIVAELEEPLALDSMEETAHERGYATDRQTTNGISKFGQDDEIELLAVYEDVESWETFGERRGETYQFVEEDIYCLGGHPYSGSETGEKIQERAAFLQEYLERL